jgi:TolA-binding protein
MRADERRDDLSAPAERLVKLACDELGEMSAGRRAEGFLRLNARRSEGARRRTLVLRLVAVAAVFALGLVGWSWFEIQRARPLSYAVDGGRVDTTGAVEADGTGAPILRFSDGTEVAFLEGARGRVKSVGDQGARIALNGKVSVAVVHWRGSRWLFDAGPFLITVTGTAFTADWREAEQRLEIALKTGSIEVSGPLFDEPIRLRAGQRLLLSLRDKEVMIRSIDSAAESRAEPRVPAESASASSAEVAQESPGQLSVSHARPASSAPSALPSSNWVAELAAGNFATILREAEQRGLDAAISEVSSGELAALADAARFSRRDDVARRALTAQRRRFPGSTRANDAAFLLGRLEEAAQRSELALGWYERCLNESPHGAYVSEALGRKMTLVQRVHGAARAVPIAEEYLRRFDNGPYAAAARALIRAP